jgi:hypothetical protein
MPDRRICRSKELLRPLDVCMGSLDTGRMPEDLKPRVEMMGDGSRRYRVDAYIAQAAAMFAVSLEIEPNGVVDMIEDEPLGRFVPLQ